MLYKAHVAGGVAVGVLASQPIAHVLGHGDNMVAVVAVVAGSAFGSLLPDIDHKGSYIGRRLPILSALSATLGHRGPTHSPIIITIVSLIAWWLTATIVPPLLAGWLLLLLVGVYLGALSHVLLDALTPSGVPALYPLKNKKFRLARIPTGGMVEKIFATSLMVFSVIYFYQSIW